MTTLESFLLDVCGPDGGGCIRVASIDPKTGHIQNKLCKTAAEVGEFASQHSNANLYFTPTRFTEKGFTREEALSTQCFRVDLDDADFPGLKQEEKRQALFEALRAFPLKPTYEVETGGGIHAYWVLNYPTKQEDLTQIEAVNYGLTDVLNADSCWDLPRLLRLPGSTNYPNAKKKKSGRTKTQVPIPERGGPIYGPNDFDSYATLPPEVHADSGLGETAAREAGDKLEGLIRSDTWFRDRWAGEDYTTKDDGAIDRSGNDYAVAQKLFDSGFEKAEAAWVLQQFNYGKAAIKDKKYLSLMLDKIFPAAIIIRDQISAVPDIQPILSSFDGIWPDLKPGFVSCLATVASLCFSELPCCLTVILMGPSGCGKSTVLNLFNDLDLDPPYFCRNDRSTVAAWVSGGKPIKGKKKEEMDLLAKARGKVMISAELAPIFKERRDELSRWFGVVASMLDGKGFKTHSGMIGDKEYKGDTTFNWLGASVPPEPEFHEIMANTGTRILFYYLDIPVPSRKDRMAFDRWWDEEGQALKDKLVADFKVWLVAFLKANPYRSLRQKSILIPEEIDERIHGYADFLCAMRQVCDVVQDWGREWIRYREREAPHRVANQLRSLARGRALIFGRSSVTGEDLELIQNICVNTAKEDRAKAIRYALKKEGKFLLDDCARDIYCADKSEAMDRLRELCILGILNLEERNVEGVEERLYSITSDYINILGLE